MIRLSVKRHIARQAPIQQALAGACRPIGFCRLHPPASAIREPLNGILRCLAISSPIFQDLPEISIFGAVYIHF
jgi:hypothetical protein